MSARTDALRELADAAEHSMNTGEDFHQYIEILVALRAAADRIDKLEQKLAAE